MQVRALFFAFKPKKMFVQTDINVVIMILQHSDESPRKVIE